jgi:hypothetical protein
VDGPGHHDDEGNPEEDKESPILLTQSGKANGGGFAR